MADRRAADVRHLPSHCRGCDGSGIDGSHRVGWHYQSAHDAMRRRLGLRPHDVWLVSRYSGISLGTGLSLGLITFFSSLIPTIVKGEFFELLSATSGQFALGGLAVCLLGIIFKAQGETAMLSVSDWVGEEELGGAVGQELMFNFVQVEPYFE